MVGKKHVSEDLRVELAPLLTSILIMAVIIGMGALTATRIPLTDESRRLMIALIVNVAMPFIILDGIFRSPIDQALLSQIFVTFLVSVLVNCLGIALGWGGAKLIRLPSKKAREVAIVSGLGNTGFIGLPLCAALFGAKGALLAAVFDAGLDFTIWTVGVLLLQDRRDFSFSSLRALVNIPMTAIVGGLAIAWLGVQPPDAVKQLTGTLAHLASPLAMLYIGMLIPTLLRNKKAVSLPLLGVPITIKLLVFPLVTALLLCVVSLPADISRVVLVQAAMPTITMASILFARCAADEEMGAMTTVFSTLIALLTIPAVLMVGTFILGNPH